MICKNWSLLNGESSKKIFSLAVLDLLYDIKSLDIFKVADPLKIKF